jgi:hypothetical protein
VQTASGSSLFFVHLQVEEVTLSLHTRTAMQTSALSGSPSMQLIRRYIYTMCVFLCVCVCVNNSYTMYIQQSICKRPHYLHHLRGI